MAVTADALRLQLDYTAWASRRLVDAVAQLTPEEVSRDFSTADHSVLGTLVHVYAADRIWLRRIQGKPPVPFIDPAVDMHLSVLQNDWPLLHQAWREWAAGLDQDLIRAPIEYQDLKGNLYKTVLWQIVLHLVNHGTHHRGQVSGFLRAMGHKPPPLDMIYYYRQLTA